MPIVLESGSFTLLEPSGPVQACNGIALPLPLLQSINYMHRSYFHHFLCFGPTGPDLLWLTTSLVVFVKFCFTITFYVVHLVAMETYPTCVRQTGTSLGAVMGSSMGILGPYIVYLVSKHTRARPWCQPVVTTQRWTGVKP